MKILIAAYGNGVLGSLWEQGRALQFSYAPGAENGPEAGGAALKPGDIYRGVLERLDRKLNVAFVGLSEAGKGYLPLADGESLTGVREMTVQVKKAAVGTKLPVLTRKLELAGEDLVLLDSPGELHFSKNIRDERVKERAGQALAPFLDRAGFILRSNGETAGVEELQAEAERLSALLQEIRSREEHCFPGTCLYKELPEYLRLIEDAPRTEVEKILVEGERLQAETEAFLSDLLPELLPRLEKYRDSLPLYKLYPLEREMSTALERRVWLPGGGYLVWDKTEAFTVIDVNSGRAAGEKDQEESFLEIDREAAREIARQMRLRNVSGMVLVDFISLRRQEDRDALLESLREALKGDKCAPEVLDITKLGIVEMTRRKRSAPLAESLRGGNDEK